MRYLGSSFSDGFDLQRCLQASSGNHVIHPICIRLTASTLNYSNFKTQLAPKTLDKISWACVNNLVWISLDFIHRNTCRDKKTQYINMHSHTHTYIQYYLIHNNINIIKYFKQIEDTEWGKYPCTHMSELTNVNTFFAYNTNVCLPIKMQLCPLCTSFYPISYPL